MGIEERIYDLRKKKGISQEDLANKIGVSRQAVSKWESKQSTPDLDKIIQLSDLFDVTTDYLLKGTEPTEKSDQEKFDLGALLYISSTALLMIGILSAFASWHAEPSAENIWGAMIIQIIGVITYFMSLVIFKSNPFLIITWLNIAIFLFMPFSMIIGSMINQLMAPYPTDLLSTIVLVICYIPVFILFISKIKKDQGLFRRETGVTR